MNDLPVVIAQGVMFVILISTLIRLSYSNSVGLKDKAILTLASIGILSFDKIKLVFWLAAVGVIWIIKYSKKDKQHGRTT
jgi:hypothetical protein